MTLYFLSLTCLFKFSRDEYINALDHPKRVMSSYRGRRHNLMVFFPLPWSQRFRGLSRELSSSPLFQTIIATFSDFTFILTEWNHQYLTPLWGPLLFYLKHECICIIIQSSWHNHFITHHYTFILLNITSCNMDNIM